MNRTIRLFNLLFTLPLLLTIYIFSAHLISAELESSKIAFTIIFIISFAIQLFIWNRVGAGFETLLDFTFNIGFFLSSFVFSTSFFGYIVFFPGNQSGLLGMFLGPVSLVLGSVIGLIVGIIVGIIKKHKYPTV